jgi:hypothetical protein
MLSFAFGIHLDSVAGTPFAAHYGHRLNGSFEAMVRERKQAWRHLSCGRIGGVFHVSQDDVLQGVRCKSSSSFFP